MAVKAPVEKPVKAPNIALRDHNEGRFYKAYMAWLVNGGEGKPPHPLHSGLGDRPDRAAKIRDYVEYQVAVLRNGKRK